eukprot:tig00000711_g3421.t1
MQLTLARVAAIPLFIVVRYMPIGWSAQLSALVFVAACVTDYVDGYLARKLNQCSRLGAFLDPVADKLMVAVALVVLAASVGSPLVTLPACVIIFREVLVSAVRELCADLGKRDVVAVSWAGKWKTACQMVALSLLLWCPDWPRPALAAGGVPTLHGLGVAFLYAAAVLTVYSMWGYLTAAWRELADELL